MRSGWLLAGPRALPSLSAMMDEVGCDNAGLAAFLEVTDRTVRGWTRRGYAPRAAALALFYETKWGRDFVAVEVENRARLLASMLLAEKGRADELEHALVGALSVGDFGSANSPTHLVDTRSLVVPPSWLPVVEQGQGLPCPALGLVDAPGLSADGAGLDAA